MSDSVRAADARRAGWVPCPRDIPVCLTTSGVLDSIGHTPLVRLRGASEATGCHILGKAEYLNPGGSIKDRIARAIIEGAEARGDLRPGSTILEVTSGNTGIGLAMVGAMKGYRVVIMMPASASPERRQMIASFGAELELLEEIRSIQAAVSRTREMAEGDPSIFLPSQFSNIDNPRCHELTTGPEIIHQCGGQLDAFVMGIGTGGTLMGVGRALRHAGVRARVVAVEPEESAVLSGGSPGEHGIQGLADGFVPEIVRVDEIDEVEPVASEEARAESRRLAVDEGLLVGISSGANIIAARRVARRLGPGRTVITVLPDRGERYLSLAGEKAPRTGIPECPFTR